MASRATRPKSSASASARSGAARPSSGPTGRWWSRCSAGWTTAPTGRTGPTPPAVAYATTSSGYLTHRLTGELRDSAANNILLQWPIDTDTWQWSGDPALFERFDVSREMLAELQLPGDVAGTVTPEASAATGIPAGLPVVTTANDKAVEALGSGSLGETTALVSLGTYIAAMVHGRENRTTPTHFWTNFACIPGRYLYESHGVRRGMWTLSWFLDLLGEEIEERAASLRLSRERYIEREAEAVPAGSDGLMTVLDWLRPPRGRSARACCWGSTPGTRVVTSTGRSSRRSH